MIDPVDDELTQLESLLEATLLPKHPRASYGQDLHRRLSNRSAPTLELPPRDDNLMWFLLVVVLSMTLLLFAIKFLVIGVQSARSSQ